MALLCKGAGVQALLCKGAGVQALFRRGAGVKLLPKGAGVQGSSEKSWCSSSFLKRVGCSSYFVVRA